MEDEEWKNMKISSLLIAIFMISIFTTGFVGFYGAVMAYANTVSRGSPASFERTINTSQTLTTIERMYNITEASQNTTAVSGAAVTDAPYNLLTGAFNTVMQTLNLPIFFMGLITDLASAANLPFWFTSAVMGIILITIIAGLVKFFAGRDW